MFCPRFDIAPTVYARNFLGRNDDIVPAKSLAALAKAGNAAARERLLQRSRTSGRPLNYVFTLEKAGMPKESAALARRLYARSPSRAGALAILNANFSVPLWQELITYPLDISYPDDPAVFYRVKDTMMLARHVTGRKDLPLV